MEKPQQMWLTSVQCGDSSNPPSFGLCLVSGQLSCLLLWAVSLEWACVCPWFWLWVALAVPSACCPPIPEGSLVSCFSRGERWPIRSPNSLTSMLPLASSETDEISKTIPCSSEGHREGETRPWITGHEKHGVWWLLGAAFSHVENWLGTTYSNPVSVPYCNQFFYIGTGS